MKLPSNDHSSRYPYCALVAKKLDCVVAKLNKHVGIQVFQKRGDRRGR